MFTKLNKLKEIIQQLTKRQKKKIWGLRKKIELLAVHLPEDFIYWKLEFFQEYTFNF